MSLELLLKLLLKLPISFHQERLPSCQKRLKKQKQSGGGSSHRSSSGFADARVLRPRSRGIAQCRVRMGYTAASAVATSSSIPGPSLYPGRVGRASLNPRVRTASSTRRIKALAWRARKSTAPFAAPISGTFSRTARRRPASATASTRSVSSELRQDKRMMWHRFHGTGFLFNR